MKINVYRVSYHTVTHALEDSADGKIKKGAELHRTSPVTVVMAGVDLAEVKENLPERPEGTENVIVQSHTLYSNVPFRENPGTPAGAIRGKTHVTLDLEEKTE